MLSIDFIVLLDLMASQPRSFAIAVLAELGNDGPRPLASALMVRFLFDTLHLDLGSLTANFFPTGSLRS